MTLALVILASFTLGIFCGAHVAFGWLGRAMKLGILTPAMVKTIRDEHLIDEFRAQEKARQ